ncbi:MAG: mannose-1-phosphate guanylyltransferase/mannose-6-phosphate isomerase [Pseudomonadota bacterium]
MIPVVLCGGVGSRLWPLSRGMYPKQLLPLAHDEFTMLQQTVQRTDGLRPVAVPMIVCNEEHRFMVGEQMQQLDVQDATIMLEPEGRNTAPAIALAAFQAVAQEGGGDPCLLVMPADHVIADQTAFTEAVSLAKKHAEQGSMVTFGIVPKVAETGYGYIKAGVDLGDGAHRVQEFKEKPSQEVAEQYISSGNYYWNGGIFVFRASVFLAELQKFAPEIYQACEKAIAGAEKDLDFLRVDAEQFASSPSDSIDYAVMEKTDKAVVVPLDAGWNDLGSWSAMWEVSEKDQAGNAIKGDVLVHDTHDSHIYSETKLVAAVGVKDMVIVETDDAVMVAPKEQSQQVKGIVNQLKEQGRSQLSHHRKVYRPWGWYDSIDVGDRFQVKRIQVKPGAKLSVQMHHHRAEHWVVVKGVAEVLNGEETTLLNENESTYIPIGVKHALGNPSKDQPLEIIEVQSGDYLGEDDIVRFEDNYGRANK